MIVSRPLAHRPRSQRKPSRPVYKLLLILKYLRKRRIAWVSLIAVTLCTAMVLIVISVMGGWLNMFRESVHNMSGDIIIHGKSITGFAYYQDMIDRIKNDVKEIKDAAPVIHTLWPDQRHQQNPQPCSGLRLSRQHRQGQQLCQNPSARSQSPHPFTLHNDVKYEQHLPKNYSESGVDPTSWEGMVISPGVIGLQKNEDGTLERYPSMYGFWVNMTFLPISEGSALDPKDKVVSNYWMVDVSRTGSWVYDNETAYVRFAPLQHLLKMDARPATDPDGNPFTDPARTNDVQISVKDGADLVKVRDQIKSIVNDVYTHAGGRRTLFFSDGAEENPSYPYTVETWQQINAQFIGAIEHEKLLVTILFSVISIVAVFLIFCIFYMIVMEKTRDIGIIKSVGATSQGVAGIFLGYGLAIGIVGAGLGLLCGWGVVHNINTLHHWLGKLLGIQIWDPKVYQFDTIPSQMNPKEVSVILGVAVLSAVIGAVVPAVRAARMHPVESLRWE